MWRNEKGKVEGKTRVCFHPHGSIEMRSAKQDLKSITSHSLLLALYIKSGNNRVSVSFLKMVLFLPFHAL